MAWEPCLVCDSRFSGPAEHVYLQRYEGDERESYRLICCPSCFVEVIAVWRQRALYKDADGDWVYREPNTNAQPALQPIPARSGRSEGQKRAGGR